VRKWKDRIRDHKPHTAPEVPVRHMVFSHIEGMEASGDGFDGHDVHMDAGGRVAPPPEVGHTPAAASTDITIVKSSKFFARPMSVQEAVMQMDLLHNDFLVFMNADTRQVNVVYRRKDGHYGLIETGDAAALANA
jgi:hypothetical protein